MLVINRYVPKDNQILRMNLEFPRQNAEGPKLWVLALSGFVFPKYP